MKYGEGNAELDALVEAAQPFMRQPGSHEQLALRAALQDVMPSRVTLNCCTWEWRCPICLSRNEETSVRRRGKQLQCNVCHAWFDYS